ncbi:MAG: ankyrin repeat domain-containing protein [Acholeplasmataceae bacterium]|jgi:ankyrin repeat protein
MKLFELALKNQLDTLKNEVTDINMIDHKRRTLLHHAIIGNAVETVLWLIKEGINVNAINEAGETALFESVRRSNLEIAKILITHNANPNIANHRYELPIHIAAYNGEWDMIKLLVEAKTILNKKSMDDKQLIHYAILGGQVELAPKIIDLTEGSYFIRDEYGNTLLHYATRTSSLPMVKYLVEKGVDVNALNDQYETPIFSSVKNNNFEIVKFLVKEGAFIDIKNRRFETPHDIAIIHDRDEIRDYLEETQYQPFYQEHKKSQALTLAVLNRDYHEIKVLAMAHTRLRPNKLGKTALDYAKEYRMKSAVQILNQL